MTKEEEDRIKTLKKKQEEEKNGERQRASQLKLTSYLEKE